MNHIEQLYLQIIHNTCTQTSSKLTLSQDDSISLINLAGLMAVDIAPRNASGAALGVVGIASYIGAGLQDVMSGVLIEGQKTVQNGVDVYDFTYINWFWIGAALLSVFFALLVWNVKPK